MSTKVILHKKGTHNYRDEDIVSASKLSEIIGISPASVTFAIRDGRIKDQYENSKGRKCYLPDEAKAQFFASKTSGFGRPTKGQKNKGLTEKEIIKENLSKTTEAKKEIKQTKLEPSEPEETEEPPKAPAIVDRPDVSITEAQKKMFEAYKATNPQPVVRNPIPIPSNEVAKVREVVRNDRADDYDYADARAKNEHFKAEISQWKSGEIKGELVNKAKTANAMKVLATSFKDKALSMHLQIAIAVMPKIERALVDAGFDESGVRSGLDRAKINVVIGESIREATVKNLREIVDKIERGFFG